MKVGIIGVGALGSACAMALMQRGSAREIVLVNRSRRLATAVALDMGHGAPFRRRSTSATGRTRT